MRKLTRGTLWSLLVAVAVMTTPVTQSTDLGSATGRGWIQDTAMIGCGACAGGALFLVLSGGMLGFLANPASWKVMTGCATSCYTMTT